MRWRKAVFNQNGQRRAATVLVKMLWMKRVSPHFMYWCAKLLHFVVRSRALVKTGTAARTRELQGAFASLRSTARCRDLVDNAIRVVLRALARLERAHYRRGLATWLARTTAAKRRHTVVAIVGAVLRRKVVMSLRKAFVQWGRRVAALGASERAMFHISVVKEEEHRSANPHFTSRVSSRSF